MAMAFDSDVNWSDPYTREQTFTTWPHTDPSPHAVSRAGFFVKECQQFQMTMVRDGGGRVCSWQLQPPPSPPTDVCIGHILLPSECQQFQMTMVRDSGASPDTVECYACGVTLSNWKPGEDLQQRHKNKAPDCPLVENIVTEQAGDAPRTGSSIETTIHNRHAVPLPRRRRAPSPPPPRYKQLEPRLASFECINWLPELEATVDKMAKAGFYYIGPHDRVKCGYCGGKLKKWRPTDSAIEEHVKHFPDCSFVKTIEKQTVVLSKNIRTKDKRESCHSHKDVMLMKEPDRLKTARISPGMIHTSVVNVLEGDGPSDNSEFEDSSGSSKTSVDLGNVEGRTARVAVETPRSDSAYQTTHNQAAPENDERIPQIPNQHAVQPGADPKYKEYDNRVRSFEYLLWPIRLHAQPHLLAKAGFYYCGPGDRVQCAFCKLKLKNWKIDDDPEKMHLQHNSTCQYAQSLEPQPDVLERYTRTQVKRDQCVSFQQLTSTERHMVLKVFKRMDYEEQMIIEAISLTRAAGKEVRVESVLPYLQALKKEAFMTAAAGGPAEGGPAEGGPAEGGPAEGATAAVANVCRLCDKERVGCVFLPCRHLVCIPCSERMRIKPNGMHQCPHCREGVQLGQYINYSGVNTL